MKSLFVVFVCIYSVIPLFAQEKQNDFTMSDFIGVNTNVASYDKSFIDDLSECAKWIREYHSWAHYEAADNFYKWDNITREPQGWTWPDHNKFMDECQRLGVNVLIDVLGKPEWAGTHRGAFTTGDGSHPQDYLDRLEFIGQLVARYGAQTVVDSLLETADKVSGLNYVKYFEDDNEPDYWWETPKWSAENYAVYCNAVHDGSGVETSEDYPLLGIKSVDSTAVHVLAGLAANSTTYIQKILDASNGRIPFDVINIHTYCNDSKDGYSPENENYGIEKKLGDFMNWCQNELPNVPVWITEFGWDTYMNNNQHSYIYAPQAQQANYILRSFFISLKMGFEKAFLFMGSDPNSSNTLQYSSSGLISDQNTGFAKKMSYYYLATMQNILGTSRLTEIVSYRKLVGENEIYCFKFLNESDDVIYALWTRKKNSKTDNGTTLNYTFDLGYQSEFAYSLVPKDKSYTGDRINHTINGTAINLDLTETPQFLFVSQNNSLLNLNTSPKQSLEIYPNPSSKEVHISVNNPKIQNVNVSVYSRDGSLIEVVAARKMKVGIQKFVLNKDYLPGIFFVILNTKDKREVKKMILN